jgi:hypothetical protein
MFNHMVEHRLDEVFQALGHPTRRAMLAGRTHVCRLAPEPIAAAHRWLGRYQRFWQERLDALEAEQRREDEAS